MDEKMPTIKERLNARFNAARETVGPRWQKDLSEAEPFFNTKEGANWMSQASNSVTDPRRISNDRLERIVIALEKLAETLKPVEA